MWPQAANGGIYDGHYSITILELAFDPVCTVKGAFADVWTQTFSLHAHDCVPFVGVPHKFHPILETL